MSHYTYINPHGKRIELSLPTDLPNSDGFRFMGMDSSYRMYRCEVVKDPVTGLHSVEGMSLSEMVGWFC